MTSDEEIIMKIGMYVVNGAITFMVIFELIELIETIRGKKEGIRK